MLSLRTAWLKQFLKQYLKPNFLLSHAPEAKMSFLWKKNEGKMRTEYIFITPWGFKGSFHRSLLTWSHCLKEENLECLSPQCTSSLHNNVSQSPVFILMLNSNCVCSLHYFATQVHYGPVFSWRCQHSLQTSAPVTRFSLSSSQHQGSYFPLCFFIWFLKVLCIFILMIMGLFTLVLLHIIRAAHSWQHIFLFHI